MNCKCSLSNRKRRFACLVGVYWECLENAEHKKGLKDDLFYEKGLCPNCRDFFIQFLADIKPVLYGQPSLS